MTRNVTVLAANRKDSSHAKSRAIIDQIKKTRPGANEEKLKQLFEFLKEKKANETDKEIIFKSIEACKCHETKVTRFLKSNKFTLFEREVRKNTHIKE